MRNFRYLIGDEFQATSIAEDLKLQLEINRFNNVNITAVNMRNEIIVQVPEASDLLLEVAIDSFMENYQTGVILE